MAGFFQRLGKYFNLGSSQGYQDRSVSDWIDIDNGSFSGSVLTDSGSYVNPEVALRFSAVYSCVNVIADTIATLPISIKLDTDKGQIEDTAHYLNELVKTEPNDYQTWFDFMHALVNTALRWGNGYALIERDNFGKVTSLRYLEPGDCSVYHTKDFLQERVYYTVMGQVVPAYNIIHIKCLGTDGIEGKSPISLLSDEIGLGLKSSQAMSKFYKNGFKSKLAYSIEGILTDSARKSTVGQISKNNEKEFILLEGGGKVTPLSLSPKDAETIATRTFQVEDIARVYRVPLHKIGSMKSSTNNNIEQQSIDFVTDCIIPWTERIEQELRKKLLTRPEKINRYFHLDTNYLMRGDATKRAQYYQSRFNTGSLTPNQIRMLEGEVHMENELANKLFIQSGTVPMEEQYFGGAKIDNQLKQGNEQV